MNFPKVTSFLNVPDSDIYWFTEVVFGTRKEIDSLEKRYPILCRNRWSTSIVNDNLTVSYVFTLREYINVKITEEF